MAFQRAILPAVLSWADKLVMIGKYWNTYLIACQCYIYYIAYTGARRLSIQRPAVLLRWVFGSSPPNRTYTSPRIRLSTNNINLFIVTEFFVTLTTYGNSLSFASHHLFFAGSFPLKIF